MTNTMGELTALINENFTVDFETSNLIGGDDLLNVIALGLLDLTDNMSIVRALNAEFVESKVATGLVGWQTKSPDIFKVGGAEVEAATLKGGKFWAKTQYQILASEIPLYMIKFMRGIEVVSLLMQMTVENYSANIVARIVAICKGLTADTDITVGSETTEFDTELINLVNDKRGTMARPHLIIMNEETLYDIMNKQQLGTIKTQHITELYHPATNVSTDGAKVTYGAPVSPLSNLTGEGIYGTVAYWYKGSVPVITSNQFPKNYVFFFEKNAFLIGYGSYASSRSYIKQEEHTSTGTLKVVKETHDCLYLKGSTLIGKLGTNYKDPGGIEPAEYEKGAVIGVPEDVAASFCALKIAHVKIG